MYLCFYFHRPTYIHMYVLMLLNMHLILFSILLPFGLTVPLNEFFSFNNSRSKICQNPRKCDIKLFQNSQNNYVYDFQVHGRFPYFSEMNITNIYVSCLSITYKHEYMCMYVLIAQYVSYTFLFINRSAFMDIFLLTNK